MSRNKNCSYLMIRCNSVIIYFIVIIVIFITVFYICTSCLSLRILLISQSALFIIISTLSPEWTEICCIIPIREWNIISCSCCWNFPIIFKLLNKVSIISNTIQCPSVNSNLNRSNNTVYYNTLITLQLKFWSFCSHCKIYLCCSTFNMYDYRISFS